MKQPLLLAAGGVVLATNAFILASAWYNRSGRPDAVVQLTEWELRLPYQWLDNSGIALQLRWNRTGSPTDEEPQWFDAAKLGAVGFDCSVPATDPRAEEHYAGALPREAFVVLEYDGPAWRMWLEQQARAPKTAEAGQLPTSAWQTKLVAVDAGSDPARLRTQYPDRARYIITPAIVALQYRTRTRQAPGTGRPSLRGVVTWILVSSIHVPRDLRRLLDVLQAEDRERDRDAPERRWRGEQQPPRYGVTVHYGRNYEPWIVQVTRN